MYSNPFSEFEDRNQRRRPFTSVQFLTKYSEKPNMFPESCNGASHDSHVIMTLSLKGVSSS